MFAERSCGRRPRGVAGRHIVDEPNFNMLGQLPGPPRGVRSPSSVVGVKSKFVLGPPRGRRLDISRKRSLQYFRHTGALAPDACDRARDAVNDAFDNGRTTDRGVSLPTQDVMVSSLPPRCQDEIRDALERTARRASQELPNCTLEFSMSRAFVIVYDAGLKGQRGLKKHTDGRKEGATLLLLISKPRRDFEGGGTRFFPSVRRPGRSPNATVPSRCVARSSEKIAATPRGATWIFREGDRSGRRSTAADVREEEELAGWCGSAVVGEHRGDAAGRRMWVRGLRRRSRRRIFRFRRRSRFARRHSGPRAGARGVLRRQAGPRLDDRLPVRHVAARGPPHQTRAGRAGTG